jgi:hypothetical protein
MFSKVKTRHSVPAFAAGGMVDADDHQAFAKGGRKRGGREVNPAWMRWLTGRVGGAAREPSDDGPGSVSQAERVLSMWTSRYDLAEEEFVRNGALSQPDIARRARELDSLVGKAQSIIQALQRRYRLATRNVNVLAWARRQLDSTIRELRSSGSPTGPVTARREEYGAAAKAWGEIARSSPFDIFEAKTTLMGLGQERAKLLPRNWAALLAEGGGGGTAGGGASSDDGRQQRLIERLMGELQAARGLSVFGGSNDIGAGGRPGLLALRHGGVVPGTGPPDSRLALVSPGERWSTPQANQQFGDVYDALERAAGRQGLGASRQGAGGEVPGMSFEPLQPLTDGRTLGLLSGAVTAGMARQGHRTSTRERTGL